MTGNLVIASDALAPRSNPESVLWTLDCFGATGRLAMTGQGVILNEALHVRGAAHSGVMPFASTNFVQFLISFSSLVRSTEAAAKSGVISTIASRSRRCWSDMMVAIAFSSFPLTASGVPLGPNRPNQNRNSTSAAFTPASLMVGTLGIAG